jgi:hypothetical protein
MAHRRAGASPRLEAMESRTLLSHAAALAAAPPTHAEVAPATAMALAGTLRGSFIQSRQGKSMISDNFTQESGKLTPIGAATITGSLQEEDGPSGTLLLDTSEGTLTLQIPDPSVSTKELPIPARHGIDVSYDVKFGTGAYLGDTGAGVVEFTFTSVHPYKGVKVAGVETLNFALDSTTVDEGRAGRVDVKFAPLPKATTTD